MLVILLLGACQDSGLLSDSATDTGDPSPSHSDEEVVEGMEEALGLVFDADVNPLFDGFAIAMSAADDTCPSFIYAESGDAWYQLPGCTTAAGAQFYGTAFTDAHGRETGDYSATFLGLLCEIDLPDGRSYRGNGNVIQRAQEDPEGNAYATKAISGGFSWTGEESVGTWVEDGGGPSIDYDLEPDPDLHQRVASLNGSWNGPIGPFTAANFMDISLAADNDGTCAQAPTGEVGLRDEAGDWYFITLDGVGDAATSACDACGTLQFREQSLGTICVDFSLLVDWHGSPW